MRLVGQSSGAIARVKDIRIVTDRAGVVIGSLFIPDPTQPSAQVFNTGSKTFTLTSSATNQTISGFTDSSAETTFTSAGTINNMQETTLRIRNANVERVPRSQSRNIRRSRKRLVAKVKFKNRKKVQTRWVDPLAQSFEVPDVNGVYLTKCDIYFRTKDAADLPVTLQVRELELGLPTQTILPFGEVVLDPSEVVTSNDGSKSGQHSPLILLYIVKVEVNLLWFFFLHLMNIPYSFQGWVKKISPQSTVQILRRLLFLNNHFLDHCSNLRMVLHGIQVSLKTSNLTCINS